MNQIRLSVVVIMAFLALALPARRPDFSVRAASDNEMPQAPLSETFLNDPSARTWLPVASSPPAPDDSSTASVNEFLRALNGRFRALGCWYQGSRLIASRAFLNGALETAQSRWRLDLHTTVVADDPGALDLDLSFKLVSGLANPAGVAAAFDFSHWSRDNYVLIPAAVYNGNRFRVVNSGYAAPYPRSDYYNKNVTLLFSDSPRLSLAPNTPAKIELLTGNAATPAICFFSPSKQRGFILLTDQKTRFGNSGLFVEENARQGAATLVASAPGVRERRAGFGSFSASGDSGAGFNPGDEVSLRFRLYSFPAKSIPGLLEKFMSVRKSLSGPNHPRNLTPFSTVTELTAQLKDTARWRENGTDSYYRPGNNNDFSVGWVGGLMDTLAMLALDNDLDRGRVIREFDLAVSKMEGKSGYFYGIYRNGKCPSVRDGIPEATLVRMNCDTLLWMIKHFLLFKAQGHADLIKPEWEDAAKRLAEAFVKTWKENGQFGTYVNAETGQIIIFNSTSGAIAPGGLALAGRYFHEPEFLEVAKASAQFYYNRDVVKLGLTGGHCGDTLQDADSESAYGFLESMMALYDVTRNPAWLAKARDVANLGATWTLSYDEEFPPGSTLNELQAHVAGAVFASVQNKHAAPGICTASGDYLFKLYRATGERRYADLLNDIDHAHSEVMDTPGRPTTGWGSGSSMERIQPTDGDGKRAIGQILHTSNGWTEGNGLLMALEIPGIYARTDKDELYVFDAVDVKTLHRDQAGRRLEITNPTRFDAKVAIFAESSQHSQQPLGYTAYVKWPKVDVEAGKCVQILIKPDGSVEKR